MDAMKRKKYGFGLITALALLYLSTGFASNLNSTAPFLAYQNLAVNTFVFNPRKLSWTAINHNGKVVRSGRASGGASYCRDIRRSCRTPTGTYSIQSKGGAGCTSSRYPLGGGGAKMPYCMFFSRYYAIHGSYDVPNHNASHGCIRVRPSDALWLRNNFLDIGSRVVVKPY